MAERRAEGISENVGGQVKPKYFKWLLSSCLLAVYVNRAVSAMGYSAS